MRDATVAVAERKAAQSAPVYCYQFAWQTPVLDGRPMAFHCSELAFVFDNPDLCEHMTGGGEASRTLASKVSQSWINFARKGNPNHPGLPEWKKFESGSKTTMVFDDACKPVDNLDTKQLTYMSNLYLKT